MYGGRDVVGRVKTKGTEVVVFEKLCRGVG